MSYKNTLGGRVYDLRTERGESQQDLADALGLKSHQSVGFIEKGTRTTPIETMFAIATHYGVSLDYLLGRSDYSSPDVSITGAQELTGLSKEAIDTLRIHKENSDNMDSFTHSDSFNFLHTVNDLLSSEEGLALIRKIVELWTPLIVISQALKGTGYASQRPGPEWANLRELEVEAKYSILEVQEALTKYIQDYMGAREKIEALTGLMREVEEKGGDVDK